MATRKARALRIIADRLTEKATMVAERDLHRAVVGLLELNYSAKMIVNFVYAISTGNY